MFIFMRTRKGNRHSANKKAVNFYIEIDLLNAISKVKFAPPGHEALEPSNMTQRLTLLIKEALEARGIEIRHGKTR